MKIHNLKSFVSGIFCTFLSLICLGVLIFQNFNIRYIIGALLLLSLAAINFVYSFKKCGVEAELIESADERELYIAMKSGHKTLQIANWILFFATITFILLYGITKIFIFMVPAITLCSVILLLLFTMFIVNRYYEDHE